MSLAPLRDDLPSCLEPYLPQPPSAHSDRPFVTVTWAQSLDARISKGPGIRTAISHPETKTMTHYLRYHHAGILIGTGTLLADNPGLNCKWVPQNGDRRTPKPVVMDLSQKWRFEGSQMWELYKKGTGKPPIVIVLGEPKARETGVGYLIVDDPSVKWDTLLRRLRSEFRLDSMMIEGGGRIINDVLMEAGLVDSIVVTIGSTILGKNGVEVSPMHSLTLKHIRWWTGTTDAIMCAQPDV
ncbi:2,5-diamino-6-(ribosylamino)-4(3H)-pyrimidinone 5'-phosphate reductase KNAG_0K02030 [Huiozyma naganishii CBS 8797]|uniref:2,5-diamino-6-ribosylamino-4(3H)-pyrimidinone 5'-phosphate reductase n=1 Tax=Huiozyma naganishii (strain ATCC MYA-139 / BCRC 22969 / CBS 8797 / KCTC 17520 / NBRC 10181 / NCYC 3082 / Yp74L-3) TaxID=1071383 RepID=J7S3E9_HUIN7|nr:hypothetical protein KNAG_0K02030 [Kazachstania naganishii CBS 8797]CCK72567.1 hypothetical protein KNAG_0K02030 [Kazachstania naganishii CBS 8797]